MRKLPPRYVSKRRRSTIVQELPAWNLEQRNVGHKRHGLHQLQRRHVLHCRGSPKRPHVYELSTRSVRHHRRSNQHGCHVHELRCEYIFIHRWHKCLFRLSTRTHGTTRQRRLFNMPSRNFSCRHSRKRKDLRMSNVQRRHLFTGWRCCMQVVLDRTVQH